jgi:PGF-pre-PGF domain-containing protein
MKCKFYVISLIVIVFLVSIASLVIAPGIENLNVEDTPLENKVEHEVLETLADEGEVKVVIKFKDDADTTIENQDLEERKEAIEEKQEEFLEEMESTGLDTIVPEEKVQIDSGVGILSDEELVEEIQNEEILDIEEDLNEQENVDIEITHQFETINAISAEIDSENTLEEIAENDLVEAIYLDYPVTISLDESIPQVNADDVWGLQASGINLTGEGETVCVIDTGIDYTHDYLGNCNPVVYDLDGDNESLGTPVESAHPYTNSYENTWTITQPGYTNIAVHFDSIGLESPGEYGGDSTDRIYVYDENNNTLAVYKGDHTDVWSPSAAGDTIYVKLLTNPSMTDYGFYIDQSINGTTNTTMNWSSCSKVIGGYDIYNNDANPMDDHWHGTHCAGIVSSIHSTYNGVAPDANLVAIKALNSGGGGYSSDVAAGIDWCTSNAERLNISVMSLSLGCDGAGCTHYQTYCNSDLTADAINTAHSNKIVVAIASGNGYWTDGISNPGCVENAMPVGAVTSPGDLMASYTNRGNILEILAPGSDIYSTKLSDSWGNSGGTSMATPHVAGAAALMKQHWRLAYGEDLDPNFIEQKLASTGVNIDDEANSNNNYSRFDILAAVQPVVTFSANSIANDTSTENNHVFTNITSDVNLSNVLLQWTYPNSTTTNITMTEEDPTHFSYNVINLNNGDHNYLVLGYDPINISGETESRTVTISLAPTITITTPANSSTHYNAFNFNINISDPDNVSYSSYSITNSSGAVVQENVNTTVSATDLIWADLVNVSNSTFSTGTYSLTVFANDSTGLNITSSTTFEVNNGVPNVTINVPSSNSYYGDGFNMDLSVVGNNLSDSYYNITNSSGALVLENSNNSISTESFSWSDYVNISNSSFVDGVYTLTTFSNNTFGNNGTSSTNFNVDKTYPELNGATVNPGTVYNNETVIFTVNVSDTNLNYSKIYLSANFSGNWTNYTMSNESTVTFNYSVNSGNLSNQETVGYYFLAFDYANNFNYTDVYNFTVENRVPTNVNITAPDNNSVIELGDSTTFTVTATDPDSDSLTYLWNFSDGTNSTSSSFSKQINTSGNYNVNVIVSDPYGSSSSDTISFVVNDSTNPSVGTPSYDASVHIESEVNQSVVVNATDLSNLSSLKLYFNDSEITTYSSSENSAEWKWDDFSTNGTYSFTVQLIDNSSNYNAVNHSYNFDVTSCSDATENGDEDGTDCGGSCSTNCTVGGSSSSSSSSSSGGGGGGPGGLAGTADDITEEIVAAAEENSDNSSGEDTSEESVSDVEESFTDPSEKLLDLGASSFSYTVTAEDLASTEEIIIPISDSKISLTEISVKTSATEVFTVNVESFAAAPSDVVGVDNAYQYLDISFDGLNNTEIEETEVNFKVERSWLLLNDYSETRVYLSSYSGTVWEKLSTSLTERGDELNTYVAKPEHFSYFVITAEADSNLISAAMGAVTDFPFFDTGLSAKHNFLIMLFLASIILVALYFFLLRPKSEKEI